MKTFYKIGYEYKELGEAAKETVKEWYLMDDMRCEFLHEDFLDDCRQLFPGSELNVQFSLASCQGDGVNIYGHFDLLDLLNLCKNGEQADFSVKEYSKLVWYSKNSITSASLEENRQYCYCTAFTLEFAEDIIDELEAWDIRDIDKDLIERFEKAAKDSLTELCSQFENQGLEYLYNCEDEEVQDACDANEWYFDANGQFIAIGGKLK